MTRTEGKVGSSLDSKVDRLEWVIAKDLSQLVSLNTGHLADPLTLSSWVATELRRAERMQTILTGD